MRCALTAPTPVTKVHQRAPTPLIRAATSASMLSLAFSSLLATVGSNQALTLSAEQGSCATKRSSLLPSELRVWPDVSPDTRKATLERVWNLLIF